MQQMAGRKTCRKKKEVAASKGFRQKHFKHPHKKTHTNKENNFFETLDYLIYSGELSQKNLQRNQQKLHNFPFKTFKLPEKLL